MRCPYCGKDTMPASVAESYLRKHIKAHHKKETSGLKRWYRGYRKK